jgi:hypothetical protein
MGTTSKVRRSDGRTGALIYALASHRGAIGIAVASLKAGD